MKTSKALLIICWAVVLCALLSFWSLMPVSQHLHVLYGPLSRLSLNLFYLCFFPVPLLAIIGLVIALLRKFWTLAGLYVALIPVWWYVFSTIVSAV